MGSPWKAKVSLFRLGTQFVWPVLPLLLIFVSSPAQASMSFSAGPVLPPELLGAIRNEFDTQYKVPDQLLAFGVKYLDAESLEYASASISRVEVILLSNSKNDERIGKASNFLTKRAPKPTHTENLKTRIECRE
jgi:hypothetical protein